MTNATEPNANRVPKGRSPSYPGVSLKAAVERARVAYGRYKKYRQPLKTFTGIWGFTSPTTGPASVTFAALKKYGLIEDEGRGEERTAVLTQLAEDILMKPDASAEIRHAALLPPIHAEMWERFKNDPPDADVLRYEFVTQRGFTETGLRDFLREWTETLAFAALDTSATFGGEQQSSDLGEPYASDQDKANMAAERAAERQRRRKQRSGTVLTYAVPVAAGTDVTIEGNFPLSEAEWSQFLAVLTAMKPGLVGDRPSAPAEPGDE